MYAFVIRDGNSSLLAFGKESFRSCSILIRLSVLCSPLIAEMRSRIDFIGDYTLASSLIRMERGRLIGNPVPDLSLPRVTREV
jgi:hypothetical protein